MNDNDVIRVSAEPVPASATEYMVPMRDGVLIATDVYLPDGEGPWPSVLVRLPYDKDSRYVFFDRIAKVFTLRGYAVVVQDVRGKFRSGGETIGAVNEAADGYDSIDWVSNQPWCNGDVGMFGDSYYGFTQWAAISAAHQRQAPQGPSQRSDPPRGRRSGHHTLPTGKCLRDAIMSAS